MSTFASLHLRGLASARPAAGIPGRYYFATDTSVWSQDNGATWDDNVPATSVPAILTTKGDIQVYSTEVTRLPVGTNGQTLVADSAEATGLKWASEPFLIPCSKSGKPDAGEILADFIPAVACAFPAGLTGSTVRVGTNPTAEKVYSFKKNGVEFGTLTIATDGTPTWASASGASFNGTSDYLQIVAPAAQDGTLAGVGICLKGTR